MTRILLSFLLLGSSLLMNAQTQPALNCFEKYAKKFEERGANNVEDGWHEGVVISIRKGSVAECIPGKVKVENGRIVAIYRQFSDGTFEETPMKKTYKSGSEIVIVNGISYSILLNFRTLSLRQIFVVDVIVYIKVLRSQNQQHCIETKGVHIVPILRF